MTLNFKSCNFVTFCVPHLAICQMYWHYVSRTHISSKGFVPVFFEFCIFLAHLSRRLLKYRQASLSVVGCPSVRRPSTILNDFSSETTGPIVTKFHKQPPGPLGMKRCSNSLDHMTKMAAMSIYSKTLKIFFSRTNRPMILKLSM